ncbi:hypothetical protein ONE63_000340 [Megalurothrips usitatus]|uniref:DUF4209 domain-containing protein n=1 Tax=Megalurothrips usitatus TaxID=439358 RepID=A0AAV7XY52_9NEOP|nr:hypothetical protein ONE63_000340 [Megalurothrips usitatus]
MSYSSPPSVSTYLSPSVQHLLVESRKDHLTYSSEKSFVTARLTLDWNCISSFLGSLPGEDVDQQVYVSLCQKLWPIFIECGRKLQKFRCLPKDLCQWTNCASNIEECFTEMQMDCCSITPMKVSLILSSIFENALGNVVYLLKNKSVPFLLRDLLASCELKNIFGRLPMIVAQTMLGTPIALNIRNICWHGFPAPQEIHADIAASLIVLITSFGEILQSVNLIHFPCRPKIDKNVWARFVLHLKSNQVPQLNELENVVLSFIKECTIIPKTHQFYWMCSFKYLCSEEHGNCLVLLLPALEHTLRCAFCSVNECPSRMLVAEQHTLYTTMDEILAQHFMGSEEIVQDNKLPSVLGERIMEMLMDMFNNIGGPRLRDKLSHGECDLKEIPAIVANHMFCVSLLVLLKLESHDKPDLISHLKCFEETYSAKFHSVSILKARIAIVLEKLNTIDTFSILTHSLNFNPHVIQMQSDLLSYSSKFHKVCPDDILGCINLYLNEPLTTVYRSKSDLSSITFLKNMVSALEQTCDNSHTALKACEAGLGQHALRSRKRASYSRMIEFIPSLQLVVKCIVLLGLIQLLSLPQQIIGSRFSRSILQYTDNIASLSSPDKSRWVEIRDKTDMFCKEFIDALKAPKGL